MPNPMHLVARLCGRYPFCTLHSTVLNPLKEACGICIIALALLVLFVATLLLDLGSSMVPSELGLELTIKPTSDDTEEAPTDGSRGRGKEGDDEEGEAGRKHSGRKGKVDLNAAEISEEDADEAAAQPSPSLISPPLSDDGSFRRTHTARGANHGRSPQLPADTVRDSTSDRVDVGGEAVNEHSPADSDEAYLDLVRGLFEDELQGGPKKAVTRRQRMDGE